MYGAKSFCMGKRCYAMKFFATIYSRKEKKNLFAKFFFISMIFDSLFVLRLLKNIFFNNFNFFFLLETITLMLNVCHSIIN